MTFSLDPALFGLLDSVALVTGSGAGIGKATALQLARAGCHVAVADINDTLAQGTASEIEALDRKAVVFHVDVRNKASVQAMVDSVRRQLGPLDVAVNMVGGAQINKPMLDLTVDEWRMVVDMNLTSAFVCCQVESLAMIEGGRKGRIVNVASSSGIVGAPNVSAYGAAKAGVIHFTKSAAMELAPFGLRVNCVVPGTHETERIRARLADPEMPAGARSFFEAAAKAPPLGRLGDPIETAGVVVFLASDLSAYVTGHSVISDGGICHTTTRPPVGGPMIPEAIAHVAGALSAGHLDAQR